MIYDLKEFGKWLNEHELVDFGKNVNSDDYILKVVYSNGNFSLDSIGMTNDIKLKILVLMKIYIFQANKTLLFHL